MVWESPRELRANLQAAGPSGGADAITPPSAPTPVAALMGTSADKAQRGHSQESGTRTSPSAKLH